MQVPEDWESITQFFLNFSYKLAKPKKLIFKVKDSNNIKTLLKPKNTCIKSWI
jgi:hypothetical protein